MKKSRLMFFALAALLVFLLVAVLMHGQTTEPGQPGSQPPGQTGPPILPPPPPPGPPGTVTPMILAAYFNCTPINYGDNITIIISAYGISTVNVTVFSNLTQDKSSVILTNINPNEPIVINESVYNKIMPTPAGGNQLKECNETTLGQGCHIYFNVSYLNGSAVVWRLSDNNLTIWESGASPECRAGGGAGPTPPPVPLPTPHIITPTRFCRDSQPSACCNTTGEKSYYYNASASIWHNATVENWLTGWNWTWSGKSSNVNTNLTNTSSDLNKINLSHIYGLKNTNATNLFIELILSNTTATTKDNVIIPLSSCIEYQPIVNITSPENNKKYRHDPLLHNATIIDPDSDRFNFTWIVSFTPWKSSKSVLYYNTTLINKNKDQANVTVKMNFTGNYTSLLLATDGKYGGSDSVSFEVINESCNCSNPITPCGAWNPSKSSGGTFCNLSKQWENYCLINENCPSGYICNASKQCQGRPSDCPVPGTSDFNKGCSFYQNQIECETDKCSLGRTDVDKLDSSYIVYYGCSWNGTSCVQNFTTLNPITGSMENCYYSTNIPPCPESGGEITITRTTICCKDGSCTPTSTTESYTCPQPISFALPGWSWLNVVLVVMLLAVFYLALWKWGRRKEKTKN
jgi:hypothetical protein